MHQGLKNSFLVTLYFKVSLLHVLTIGLGFGLVINLQLLLVEGNCKKNHHWLSIFHIHISTTICSLCLFMLILLAKISQKI